MAPLILLQWHYLIFIVPCGLSALFLLLSTVRLGHHGVQGHIGAHGGASAHTHAVVAHHSVDSAHGAGAHGLDHPVPRVHAQTHVTAARNYAQGSKDYVNGAAQVNPLLALVGVGKAPIPMVVEAFFLVWGLAGSFAIQLMLRNVLQPTLAQVAPALGIAAGCGIVGARISAEMISRLMPQDESSVVSREGLYGLKGRVAYVVSETGGRIMVYDDYGSLHDETCRVTPGHPPIEKGRRAIVMDRDASGHLLVEEVPD